ncbi:hypothetical protein MRX96_048586 [Rhipicephalus microplus]
MGLGHRGWKVHIRWDGVALGEVLGLTAGTLRMQGRRKSSVLEGEAASTGHLEVYLENLLAFMTSDPRRAGYDQERRTFVEEAAMNAKRKQQAEVRGQCRVEAGATL